MLDTYWLSFADPVTEEARAHRVAIAHGLTAPSSALRSRSASGRSRRPRSGGAFSFDVCYACDRGGAGRPGGDSDDETYRASVCCGCG